MKNFCVSSLCPFFSKIKDQSRDQNGQYDWKSTLLCNKTYSIKIIFSFWNFITFANCNQTFYYQKIFNICKRNNEIDIKAKLYCKTPQTGFRYKKETSTDIMWCKWMELVFSVITGQENTLFKFMLTMCCAINIFACVHVQVHLVSLFMNFPVSCVGCDLWYSLYCVHFKKIISAESQWSWSIFQGTFISQQ